MFLGFFLFLLGTLSLVGGWVTWMVCLVFFGPIYLGPSIEKFRRKGIQESLKGFWTLLKGLSSRFSGFFMIGSPFPGILMRWLGIPFGVLLKSLCFLVVAVFLFSSFDVFLLFFSYSQPIDCCCSLLFLLFCWINCLSFKKKGVPFQEYPVATKNIYRAAL